MFNTFTYTANHYPRIIEVTVLEAVKLKFLPPKAEFLLSNSRKRGSAFCLRFDLINQFDGAFLPYR